MLARSVRRALIVLLLALWPAAAAQASSLWTLVATPTTHTISAIAYPSAGEVVLVTTAGDILHGPAQGPYTASTVSPPNPSGFTDVATSADGTKGVAVGPSGMIYHSTDSGATWTQVTAMEYPGGCGASNALAPLTDDLYSVQFADASTVYVTGANRDVLKSTDGGGSFSEVNKTAAMTCNVNPSDDFSDTAWIDANHGFLMSKYFGDYFATTDGMMSLLGSRKGEALNTFGAANEFALDPSDPTRAWAVSSYGSGGSLTFEATTDGGTTWASPNYDRHNNPLRDIATAGGTVIAVGDSGDIYTSPDGKNFNRQIASPPNSGNNWHAVAMLGGTDALVGGGGGQLVFSSRANQLPDNIPPTGTISGPTRLARGQFGRYTAHVTDNPGGSGVDPSGLTWSTPGEANQTGSTATFAFSSTGTHVITLTFRDLAGNSNTTSVTVHVGTALLSGSNPTTATTGGGTVTVYKKVTVTGRKGRFVPVVVSTKKPRRFVVTILTIKGHHHIGVAYATFKKQGKKTVEVGLSRKVKLGEYLIVVRVFTLKGHGLGRTITVAFILV